MHSRVQRRKSQSERVGQLLVIAVLALSVLATCASCFHMSDDSDSNRKICGFQSFTNHIYNTCYIRRRRRRGINTDGSSQHNQLTRSLLHLTEDDITNGVEDSMTATQAKMISMIKDLYKQCCTIGCNDSELSTICYFMFSAKRR